MKYEITYSCGHTCIVNLVGKNADRARRIKYMEEYGACPDCYREQKNIEKSIGCVEITMKYAEYKKDYADCKTKAGSYDGTEKTIVVYVPEERAKEENTEKTMENDTAENAESKTENEEENVTKTVKKITFKNKPELSIYVGTYDGAAAIWDRIWAHYKKETKPLLIQGGTYPEKFDKYNGVLIEEQDGGKYYFEYISENKLMEIMLKQCNETKVENVDVCDLLHTEKPYEPVMKIPDTDDDEQPFAFDYVACPKNKVFKTEFLQCMSCPENKTCEAYLNVKIDRG